MHLRSEGRIILQALVKGDLLKFVNGNVLMDIDVPTVLVVMLPLDALSYKEATIFVFGTNCLRSRPMISFSNTSSPIIRRSSRSNVLDDFFSMQTWVLEAA